MGKKRKHQQTYIPHPDEFHNSDYRGLGKMVPRPKSQAPKPRNEPLYRAMVEVRRSNKAAPHRNKAKYTRKQKHKGWSE